MTVLTGIALFGEIHLKSNLNVFENILISKIQNSIVQLTLVQ